MIRNLLAALAVSALLVSASSQPSFAGGEFSAAFQTAPAAEKSHDREALERLAETHNPTLEQARAHVRAEEAKAEQAGLYPNPRVGYSAEQIGVDGTPGEFHGAFVSQDIVTAGKLRLSRQKYAARAQAARAVEQAQTLRVLNGVRMHYWRTLGAAELVKLRHNLEKNAEDHLVTVREMLNLGQANQADLHLATAAWQQAKLNRKIAENDYRAVLDRLASVVGVDLRDGKIAGAIDAEPTLVDYEQAVARLLEHSPQIAEARLKLRADELTVKREKAEPIPNLRFEGAVGRNFEAKETVYAAGVSIELPIFDRNQGSVRQAQADLDRQHAEVRRIELFLRRLMADQYRNYISAFQQAQDYRTVVVPETRNAYEQRLRSYKEDRETWPAVLMAERHYFDSRVAYVQSLVAWREQEVAVAGMLLVDGLMAPPGPTPPGHIGASPKPR